MHLIRCWLPRARAAALSLMALAVLAGLSTSVSTPVLAAPVVLAGADALTAPVRPGETVTLTATAISSTDLSALVDVELYDPTGWRAFAQFFDQASLSSNHVVRFPVDWHVPSTAARGTWTMKVGVVQPGWGALYVWNDNALSFSVAESSATIAPTVLPTATQAPSSTAASVSASVTPKTSRLAAGSSAPLVVTVSAPSPTTALIDVEIADAGGARIFQVFQDNQVLNGTRTFAFAWPIPQALGPGNYTVKVGVIQPNWGPLHTWSDNAATITVTAPVSTPTSFPQPTATPLPTHIAPIRTPQPSSTAASSTDTSSSGVGSGKMFGINEAGGEFAPWAVPGTLNTSYAYPADAGRARYFSDRGLKLVRLPILWERIQPSAFGPLSGADVAGIRASLDTAQAAGQMVILDLHNYGRYYNTPLGTGDAGKLANVWRQLAQTFNSHPALYGYELMNEPHDLPGGSESWASLAQAATDAIRAVDRSAWVLVPGYSWQGAWQWSQSNRSLNVQDSTGRILYAAHQYFDADGSGTYGRSYEGEGAFQNVGAERLRPFLDWLDAHKQRGIITEYGVPSGDVRWLGVLDTFLDAMANSPSILGGTYWAAGPWWGTYPLSVEPTHGDSPQISVLTRYPSR